MVLSLCRWCFILPLLIASFKNEPFVAPVKLHYLNTGSVCFDYINAFNKYPTLEKEAEIKAANSASNIDEYKEYLIYFPKGASASLITEKLELAENERQEEAIIAMEKEAEEARIAMIKEAEEVRIAMGKAKLRAKQINKQFSPFDNSHVKLEKYIKKYMNDPDSFEHVETKFRDEGVNIFIYTTYRGTNVLGAKVISTISAKVDIEGNILQIIK